MAIGDNNNKKNLFWWGQWRIYDAPLLENFGESAQEDSSAHLLHETFLLRDLVQPQ